jgi:hypothetical protein
MADASTPFGENPEKLFIHLIVSSCVAILEPTPVKPARIP